MILDAQRFDRIPAPNRALVWYRSDRCLADLSACSDDARAGWTPVQASAGSRPTLATEATFGGKRVTTFDGANDFYGCGSIAKPTAFTLIVVASKVNVATISKTLCAANQASGSSVGCWATVGCEVAGELTFGFSDGTASRSAQRTTASGIANNTPFVLSATYSGSGTTFAAVRINGVAKALSVVASSSSSIGGAAQPFSIGRTGGYNGEYWDGKVAELILAGTQYTTQELLRIERSLGNYWGITVA